MNKPVRTMIIEDESLARDLLKNYLREYRQIDIIGEESDGFQAVKSINKNKPDLIFLDIKIPKLSGFEIWELLEYKPLVIFTTAYDEYAVKAFEMNAVDYLLKPYSRERFHQAIEKVCEKEVSEKKVKTLERAGLSDPILKRLVVKSGKEIVIIPLEDLVFIEASDDHVMIHTKDKRYLKQNTLKYYESHLSSSEFIRVHRSYLVHVSCMARLEQYDKESYRMTMSNNAKIPVSKSGYRRLKIVLHI